ncbi:MAG: hypothetical protein ABL983_00745 [Nitrospira sp.]|nr:hypothetical protein [Nitrospira sp.]
MISKVRGFVKVMRKQLTLRTSNIPIMNLRKEFEEYLELLKSDDFRETLFDLSKYPVHVPSMAWDGMPHDLLTLMLQRSILGLEAYVSAAVSYELELKGDLSEQVRGGIDNPCTLNRKLVVAIYDKLPEFVSVENKLSVYNQSLFQELQKFYKNLRNPIFHGNQVESSSETYEQVVLCFELLADIYGWIDTWYRAFPTRYKGTKPLSR